jgi:hypothetical protein
MRPKKERSILDEPVKGRSFLDSLATGLVRQDSLGFVLRIQLHIERELECFTCAALPNPNELGRVEYSARVRLALACGLSPELKPSLNALGALRNKFAHRLGTDLTDDEVNRFVATLPEIIKLGFSLQYEGSKGETQPNIHKLGYCLLMLWSAVCKETQASLDSLAAPESDSSQSS